MSVNKIKNTLLPLLICLIILVLQSPDAKSEFIDESGEVLKLRSSGLWRGINNLIIDDGIMYTIYNSGLAIFKPREGFLGLDTLAMLPLEHAYENAFRLFNEYLLYNLSGGIGFVFVENPENPFVVAESDLKISFLDAAYRSLYLYLACEFEGVKVFYMGNRDNPALETILKDPAVRPYRSKAVDF